MLRGLSAFPFFSFDGRDLTHSGIPGQEVQTYTLTTGLKLAERAAMILLALEPTAPLHFVPALIHDRRPAMSAIICMSVSLSLHRAARSR
jgi:hypothetical protein